MGEQGADVEGLKLLTFRENELVSFDEVLKGLTSEGSNIRITLSSDQSHCSGKDTKELLEMHF